MCGIITVIRTAFFLLPLNHHLNDDDARQIISLSHGAMIIITGTLTREIPRDISHCPFPKFRARRTGTEEIDGWDTLYGLIF